MKKIALALAIVTVTGCSTTVVPPSQAISASKEHVFKYQENEGNNGSLTIVRDSGFVGAGCYATVYLNGERVAKLDPKEKATFYLSEGEWAVGANLEGKGLCSLNRERQERFFNIKAGEKKAARVFTDAKEGANKQVISSQADSLIKISRIWADF
ncbi:hypothetical protein, partial [Raoultella ornithinolytica]|uniref:hypothetical protein n=3 Tax=Bacteria TaxID=2 RepID=UPI0023501833